MVYGGIIRFDATVFRLSAGFVPLRDFGARAETLQKDRGSGFARGQGEESQSAARKEDAIAGCAGKIN
jgi:hypothetical protein